MSAHAVVPDLARQDGALREMGAVMRAPGIDHVTLQIARADLALCAEPCAPPPCKPRVGQGTAVAGARG